MDTIAGLLVLAVLAWALHRAERVWLRIVIALAAICIALVMLGFLVFDVSVTIEPEDGSN